MNVDLLKRALRRPPRGVTLIELMIVVAVIGILAAIGGVSYTKYVKQGKITKLKQYAMDVARGQEQYRSRNNVYFEPTADFVHNNTEWSNLLEFNPQVTPDITISTQAGIGAGCDGCPVAPPGTTENRAWYIVVVQQDLNPSSTVQTTVVLHNDLESPIVLNEGE